MALKASGTADRCTCGVSLTGYNVATVTYWLWWDSYLNNDAQAIEYTPDMFTQAGFHNQPSSSGGNWTVTFGDGTNRKNWFHSRAGLPVAQWNHVMVSYSYPAQGIAAYFNGAFLNPLSTSGTSPGSGASFANSIFYLMHHGGGPSLFGLGRMAELAIWGGRSVTAFGAAEALALYNGVSPFDIVSGQMELLGYYPMENVQHGYRNRVTKKHTPILAATGALTNLPHNIYGNLSTDYRDSTFFGGIEVTTTPTDASFILVDIQPSSAEIADTGEFGTVYVDIQPSGPDGVNHLDAATVYCDITIHTCEWFVPVPESQFIWTEYTKWSEEAQTAWSVTAQTKWQWSVQPVVYTPEEICT